MAAASASVYLESMHTLCSRALLAITSITLVGSFGLMTGWGPLNPPAGAVAPTAKPLTEVEPRTAINATNTPGTATSLFKITQPGSYYLTGNITGVSGKSGIEIAASNVTLDLKGYSLQGVAGSISGVVAGSSTQNLIVRNGTTNAWGVDGIGLGFSAVVVESIVAEGNGQDGIDVGSQSVVRSCIGHSNTLRGIIVGTGSTVSACTASANGAQGIVTNSRSTVTACAAEGNTGDGISASFGTLIADCSSGSNTGNGIAISQGGMVSRCFVSFNGGNGIVTGNDGAIVGNACDNNATANIVATSSDNRIEGNTCTDSAIGIRVVSAGNIIIRNTCSGNTTDWDFVANNNFGPILDRRAPASAAVSGFSAAGTLTTTDPHANISF